jgi:hypothetical protein
VEDLVNEQLLTLLSLAPTALHLPWVFACFHAHIGHRTEAGEWIMWLLKWPALISVFVSWGADCFRDFNPWMNAIILLVQVGTWWYLKDVGDDDWRKRKRRALRDRVASLGHRLTVVPAGA